jgi:hypothetical protein
MAGQNDVERIEPYMLTRYLEHLRVQGTAEVGWNKERLSLEEAERRAAGLTDTSTVVVDGTQLYVAEPDHSADEAPRPRSGVVPLQIWPRRTS